MISSYRISIRRIVEKISRLATEDTLWINVDFTSKNQRLRQKLLMWAQYRFFRISAGIEAPRLFDSRPLYTTGWLGNIGMEITRFGMDLSASNVQTACEYAGVTCDGREWFCSYNGGTIIDREKKITINNRPEKHASYSEKQ